jgi:hypothetical protein
MGGAKLVVSFESLVFSCMRPGEEGFAFTKSLPALVFGDVIC